MVFTADLLDSVTRRSPQDAWGVISSYLWEAFSAPISTAQDASSEVIRRDRSVTELENALSSSCWDLWENFDSSVPKTSQSIVDFWDRIHGGKAVLILDGMSLRETPWLLEQAQARGYTIHESGPRGAEIPCETTEFANALGFPQRSSLSNNGASGTHKLPGAATESTDLNWQDCVVGTQEGFVYWHHWPDHRIHVLAKSGDGPRKLIKESQKHLASDEFWSFVERMATGRRLVITSDHGYAASGFFPDITERQQVDYMKQRFKSGRKAVVGGEGDDDGVWLPPVDLRLSTSHGVNRLVLGRRKWRSPGGYPTLCHGGLSLLEMFVPFFELSK